ncbi:MAG TPA: YihY/virulence factor BrkB family protein [Gaiellales bacterium]|nr:YihY/virulence factor BrkB family protein [Gaiellales bacterium]
MATPGHTVLRPFRNAARQGHPVLAKFVQDRGPHLAAMVAYYALLSLVPFMFLAVSLLGLFGQLSASSYLIRELGHILPGQSTHDLLQPVRSVQRNATTLSVIGLLGIVWASLGFYSALESALNIVFRVQNRAFLHQKWVTFSLVVASVVVLFASLLTTIAATGWVDRHAPHLIQLNVAAYLATMAGSSVGSFIFLLAIYRYLTNVDLHRGDVWPGALVGAGLFQLSFQALPLYLRFSDQLLALRAFGGLVILLVWLYLMANIIVLGAEINWFHWSRRQPSEEELSGLA